ncbi:Uncharacterised protein [Mycobacteroides abscessus subsp. abscessus]|nr:Uncharacterised protein [Mycobacteroides abscessus subsp. abscessus]
MPGTVRSPVSASVASGSSADGPLVRSGSAGCGSVRCEFIVRQAIG